MNIFKFILSGLLILSGHLLLANDAGTPQASTPHMMTMDMGWSTRLKSIRCASKVPTDDMTATVLPNADGCTFHIKVARTKPRRVKFEFDSKVDFSGHFLSFEKRGRYILRTGIEGGNDTTIFDLTKIDEIEYDPLACSMELAKETPHMEMDMEHNH